MKHLVIGNTSQLAHYFPKDKCEFISSRNIDVNKITSKKWDKIFVCFAEQRTFIEDDYKLFYRTNVQDTLLLVEDLQSACNKIVIYLTAELWNQYIGGVSITDKFDYDKTPYIESKKELFNLINNDREFFPKVVCLFPVNFNSIHRKKGYLFSKIFNSIKNKEHITIGNTYFYRDLVHPKFVVKQSLDANKDSLIGAGRLTFVNDFIRDLYKYSDMDYTEYVKEDDSCSLKTARNIYYIHSNKVLYPYKQLLNDTLEDLKI